MAWCSTCNSSGVDIEELYSRTVGNAEVREGEIKALIPEIREIYTWTSHYNKEMKRIEPTVRLLKDLDTDHILNIIENLSERETIYDSTKRSICIMVNELKYRYEQKSMGL